MYFLSTSCLGEAQFDSLGQERKEAAACRVYSKTNSSTLKHRQAQIECRSAVGWLVSVGVWDDRKDEVRGLSVCTPGDLYGHNALRPKPKGPAASDPDVSLWYRIRSPVYGSAGAPGCGKQTNPSFPLSLSSCLFPFTRTRLAALRKESERKNVPVCLTPRPSSIPDNVTCRSTPQLLCKACDQNMLIVYRHLFPPRSLINGSIRSRTEVFQWTCFGAKNGHLQHKSGNISVNKAADDHASETSQILN